MEIAEAIVALLLNRKSVFLTGGGGVGKTYTVRHVIDMLESKGIDVLKCATTGAASTQIPNAMTLHTAFSLPIDFPEDEALVTRALRMRTSNNKFIKKKVEIAQCYNIMVVDEVSMASAWLIECLDIHLRIFRGIDEPMGGMTILFVGDFLQLPPVYRKTTSNGKPTPLTQNKLAYQSHAWKELRPITMLLTKIRRQTEKHFMGILNKIRYGEPLTTEEKASLKARVCMHVPTNYDKNRPYVHIAVKRNDVHLMNQKRYLELKNLKCTEHAYKFPTKCEGDVDILKGLEADVRDNVYLGRDEKAQKFILQQRVMCVANTHIKTDTPLYIVNGDTGSIVGFRAMPNGSFGVAMLPVADADVLEQSNVGKNTPKNPKLYPVVHFDRLKVDVIVASKVFKRKIRNGSGGKDEASLCAVPLISAFACTVHKVQGCTISIPVTIDCTCMNWFSSTFYVALSRATSLPHVSFLQYHGEYKANEDGKAFYIDGTVVRSEKDISFPTAASMVEALKSSGVFFYIPGADFISLPPKKAIQELIRTAIKDLSPEVPAPVQSTTTTTDDMLLALKMENGPCIEEIDVNENEDCKAKDASTHGKQLAICDNSVSTSSNSSWEKVFETTLTPMLEELYTTYDGHCMPGKRKHVLISELENFIQSKKRKL